MWSETFSALKFKTPSIWQKRYKLHRSNQVAIFTDSFSPTTYYTRDRWLVLLSSTSWSPFRAYPPNRIQYRNLISYCQIMWVQWVQPLHSHCLTRAMYFRDPLELQAQGIIFHYLTHTSITAKHSEKNNDSKMSIFLFNIQFLRQKTDELFPLLHFSEIIPINQHWLNTEFQSM